MYTLKHLVAKIRFSIENSLLKSEFSLLKRIFTTKCFSVWAYSVPNFFTSKFIEQMEVLKYRQKFEVELSTFPDSTNA